MWGRNSVDHYVAPAGPNSAPDHLKVSKWAQGSTWLTLHKRGVPIWLHHLTIQHHQQYQKKKQTDDMNIFEGFEKTWQ